ncbi:MAG: TRAP transporter substrate-binding protein DctP [Thermoanaerobaculia bacterium]
MRLTRFLRIPAVLLALALGLPAASAEPVKVKLATLVPEGSLWHQLLLEMAETWKTVSKDQVRVQIYAGSVAGDDGDVVRKMRLGTLNAGLLTSAGISTIDRSVYALQVPMMYTSYDEVDYVLEKMQPKLEAALEAKGFIVLNWVDGGWIRFFTKTPVTRPEDLKALKLFAWAGDNDALEIWKQAGFNPVPLPATEISTALQTGLVTALPTTPQAAVILQWYNHARNMTDVKWAMLLGATVISKSVWEKIPADIRPALLKSARDTGKRLREEIRKGGDKDVDAMKKRGVNVIVPDAAAQAAWRTLVEGVYPKIRGSIVPADAFDEARKHLAQFRAQSAPAKK